MRKIKSFALIFMFCAVFLLMPSVSQAKDVYILDAQDTVTYNVPDWGDDNDNNHPAISTLKELFAQIVASGDTVYVVENWGGVLTGNEPYSKDVWDADGWSARFVVSEAIEISKDVAIYASCKGKLGKLGTVELVNPSTEADMTDDLTTFEGQKCQVFKIMNGAKVTIANLRIVGAYSGSSSNGGAIAAFEGSDILIKNCWITDNGWYEYYGSYGSFAMGTGIYANASKITVQSCDISNNKNLSYQGGGIAIENGAYALIRNSTITSNDTKSFGSYSTVRYGSGGGIAVMRNSSADIVNCVISKNTGNYGGGVYVSNAGSSGTNGVINVTITDCTISDNFCGYNHKGGGIYIEYSLGTVTACTISGNVVSGDKSSNSNGGGVYISYPAGPVTITDCVITGNSANAYGGGVYVTGGSYVPVITNSLISNNYALSYGGGVAVSSAMIITACTITGNNNPGNGGGGLYVSGNLLMTNSTVTRNSTSNCGGGIYYASNVSGSDSCMLSNCTIVDNYADKDGLEIQRDGAANIYRIPIVNSLIYNSTSPDRTVLTDTNDTYDRSRMMFFNCAIPEELTLPARSLSFDILQIASWDNPVSSNEIVNGVTHTLYKIEDNSALKSIVGAGASTITYKND